MRNLQYKLLLIALFASAWGCSPKITSTKTFVKESYRDSNIVVKTDSATVELALDKGLTEPQKSIIDALDMPSDTVKEGNFEVITHIHKGRQAIKIIDLPHKQLVHGLNKTTETTTVTTIVVKPSFWERFKSHIHFLELIAVIVGALWLVWHFRLAIIKLFV